ncbi:MAG: hypothetical protein ACOYD1_07765 [Candidatus Nanopelagicales bacterium]
MTELPPEVEALQEDASSLVPAIIAILTAASAYAASRRAVTDLERDLELAAKAGTVLANVALRALATLLSGLRSKAAQDAVSANRDQIVERAVADAMKVLVSSLDAVIMGQRKVLRGKARVKVSPAGTGFVEPLDVPGNSDDPKALAQRVVQTVRNSAVYNAAVAVEEDTDAKVYKTWHDVGDARVRSTHAFLGSRSYEFHRVEVGHPFITIAGNKLLFPGDPSAPYSETRSCRCWLTFSTT